MSSNSVKGPSRLSLTFYLAEGQHVPVSTVDGNGTRTYIAAEIRAEMARQRKTVEGAGLILGLSKQAVSQRWRGARDFRTHELMALAEWMGVPLDQFLPPSQVKVAS
jgi:hypothetical protein